MALVCASRLSAKGFNHILPADCLVEMKYASHDTNSRVFPVFLFGDSLLESTARPNTGKAASEIAGAEITSSDWMELNQAVLAILNSSKYRLRYFEEIKNDFVAIPQLSNKGLRRELAKCGHLLMGAQLLKTQVPDSAFTFKGTPGSLIEVPELQENRLHISNTDYFLGVTREIFEFNLAGYQVCKNWVSAGNKSGLQRKGTALTQKAIAEYRQVLFGIQETINLRERIDKVLGDQLGW